MTDFHDPTKDYRTIEDIKKSCGIDDVDTIKTLGQRNFRFFFEHILGYETGCPVTEKAINFHQNPDEYKKTTEDMDAIKAAIMAPRGHSKTVSWTMAPTVWRSWKEQGKGIILASASKTQSIDILEDVKRIIVRNELLEHLKPSPDNLAQLGDNADIEDDEKNWAAQSITTTTDVTIQVKTFGSGIRGKHVDYVFLDDVLQDENAGSRSTEQEKENFYNVISPIIENKGGVLQIVGTPMSHDDLLMELINKENYYTEKYKAYYPDDDRVLWPDKWSVEGLEQKKAEIGPARFAREYMCVEEGTLIQMKHGLKKIEDIEKGEEVLTHNGNYKEVLTTFDNGEQDTLAIRTPGYSEAMNLTPNHPVRTTDGWKNAEDLSTNDYLVSPRVYGDETMDKDMLRLYGWYVAEGSIGANGGAVRLCTNSDEFEKVTDIVESAGYNPKHYGGNSDNVEPITINSKELATELEEKFGRAKDKKVWSKIHELDLEHQEVFLKAYLNGDGYKSKDGVYSSRSVVRNVSESMARIGTALGWTVTRDYDNEGTDFKYEGRECEGSDYHRVRYYQNSRRAEITEDYVAYPVDAVNGGGSAQTYNLEVADDNSYHLPMFAVHNCNPMSVEEQYFSVKHCIEPNRNEQHYKPKVSDSEYNNWDFVLGVDVALSDSSGSDYNVFTVIGDPRDQDERYVVDIVRQQSMSPKSIADTIERLDNRYGFKEGFYERNAQGEGLYHEMDDRNTVRTRIEPFDTTRKTRPQILSSLQAALYRQELKIPNKEKLIDELAAFHKNGRGKLEGKGHDDTVMSLAIAYECLEGEASGQASMGIIGGDMEDEDWGEISLEDTGIVAGSGDETGDDGSSIAVGIV